MTLTTALAIVWLHFVADFVMQSDRVALNKSRNSVILLWHVLLYGLFFVPFGLMFAVVNSALHFATDFCTSRATSALWKKDQRHWFFVVIGLDQAIHMTCLFVTYEVLV
jgi:hypothetical protein